MDEPYLYAATRYVELNPVRAGLASEPAGCRWSRAWAHMEGQDDVLVQVQPLLDRSGDWRKLLVAGLDKEDAALMRGHERTGRPLGSPAFVERLEKLLNRVLKRKKPGLKARSKRSAKPRGEAKRR